MKNVPVSNGELLDKLSVLEIKKDKGLQVDKELKLLKTEAVSYTHLTLPTILLV